MRFRYAVPNVLVRYRSFRNIRKLEHNDRKQRKDCRYLHERLKA